ncbi:MAG: hypothetical protein PHT31_06200 [Candidatus Omnitrophica bacterium]|nr:hypothetical protein [Candidatus Omnitrophota bacterium]MDD5653730.1 hypothetical protein [Candidatus Omnitrophota bacterium]
MIAINFSLAVALFAVLFLAVFFGLWVCAKRQKDKDLSLDDRFIWFCGVCTYTYINTRDDGFSTCPRCGSYNKK